MPRRRVKKVSAWGRVKKMSKALSGFGKSGRTKRLRKTFIPQMGPSPRRRCK